MAEKDYVYEIDPYNSKIIKLPLTETLELKLGEMESFQVKKTYLHVCYSSDSADAEWILDLPELPKKYKGSFEKIKFKGKCYLAGSTYKIGNGEWKVMRFPTFYDDYIKEWIKWM